MAEKIEEQRFGTVDDLFDYLSPWGESPMLDGFIFRGHAQESYQLVPTALRIESADNFWKVSGNKPVADQWKMEVFQIGAEYSLLRTFYRLADQRGLEVPISDRMRLNLAQDFDFMGLVGPGQQDVWVPRDMHEVAGLAQHYGVPTRLLDWTYDIYVALYFAFKGGVGKDGNLAIWALNKEYLSSLKMTVNRGSVEFITPHYSGNPNLSAQKGLFTLWPFVNPSTLEHMNLFHQGKAHLTDRRPLDERLLETLVPEENIPIFKKFIVPCSEANRGCMILDRLGYNPSRIFPGYGGVAEQVLTQHKHYR